MPGSLTAPLAAIQWGAATGEVLPLGRTRRSAITMAVAVAFGGEIVAETERARFPPLLTEGSLRLGFQNLRFWLLFVVL